MTNNHLHHSCANNSSHVEEETYTKQNCMNNHLHHSCANNISTTVQTTAPMWRRLIQSKLSCKRHQQMTQANQRKMAGASQPVIVSFLTSREEGNKSAAYKS
jgi:hypothetical protein